MMKFKKGEKVEVMKKNKAHVSDEAAFLEFHKISSRSLKRMSAYESCILEAHNRRCIKKIRAIEENGLKLRLVPLLENRYHQIEKPKPSEEIDTCSVGSCSIINQSSNNFYNSCKIRTFQNEADDTSSYAESCCILQNKEAEVSINSLELYAYRRTLEALYVSGPLSWEQEEMLTNLRIMLHISNDVHLMEDHSLDDTICLLSRDAMVTHPLLVS